MFSLCSSLTSLDLSSFNCGNIKVTKDMVEMFKECEELDIEDVKYQDFKIRNQLIVDMRLI